MSIAQTVATPTSNLTIIGVSGTLLSGKDSLANYLVDRYGFVHYSTADMLRAEKKKVYGDSPEAVLLRGDPFANNLRAERGAGILVEMAYQEFLKTGRTGVVISGIRSIGEAKKLKELGGRLVFVDSDPKIRYERGHSRQRDHQDTMTYQEFLAQEATESEGIDQNDKTIQNLPAMKRLADIQIYNNDNDLQKFLDQADKAIFTL